VCSKVRWISSLTPYHPFSSEALQSTNEVRWRTNEGPLAHNEPRNSWTVGELLKSPPITSETRKLNPPRLNAEVLVSHQLQLEPGSTLLEPRTASQRKEVSGYRALIKRRVNRETAPTCHRHPGVLVFGLYREPTGSGAQTGDEVLVEEDHRLYNEKRLGDHPKILDLGTGSGVIAVVLCARYARS